MLAALEPCSSNESEGAAASPDCSAVEGAADDGAAFWPGLAAMSRREELCSDVKPPSVRLRGAPGQGSRSDCVNGSSAAAPALARIETGTKRHLPRAKQLATCEGKRCERECERDGWSVCESWVHVCACGLHPADMHEKCRFEEVDTDGSGFLDWAELFALMQGLGNGQVVLGAK